MAWVRIENKNKNVKPKTTLGRAPQRPRGVRSVRNDWAEKRCSSHGTCLNIQPFLGTTSLETAWDTVCRRAPNTTATLIPWYFRVFFFPCRGRSSVSGGRLRLSALHMLYGAVNVHDWLRAVKCRGGAERWGAWKGGAWGGGSVCTRSRR